MQEYVVCIPSYRRPRLCNDLTLTTLATHGIDPARIYVYVADEAEREIYQRTLDGSKYGTLVVAVPGIVNIREFIIEQWPEGTNIVSVDDDIRDVTFGCSADYGDMHTFLLTAFEECRRRGAYIWGVYPLSNPFFLRGQELTTDLRYVVGAFYGFINRPRLEAIRWDISRQCQGAKDDDADGDADDGAGDDGDDDGPEDGAHHGAQATTPNGKYSTSNGSTSTGSSGSSSSSSSRAGAVVGAGGGPISPAEKKKLQVSSPDDL
jgi:hypothetical protein